MDGAAKHTMGLGQSCINFGLTRFVVAFLIGAIWQHRASIRLGPSSP